MQWSAADSAPQSETIRQVGSDLSAGDDLTLIANNDLTAQASQLSAGKQAYLVGGNDVALIAANDEDYYFYQKKTKSGSLVSSKKMKRDEVSDTRAVGTTIDTGGDLTIASGNDQTYQRARLAADGDMTLSAGCDITFSGAMDTHTESHEKSKSNWAWQSAKGKGTTDQTLRQSELVAQGQLAIQAANRVAIEVPEIDAQSVRQTVNAMVAADPNLAWLKQAETQGDIDWRTVKEIHDGWDYSQSGLGKGAAIAISIAAAAVVGPMAAGLAGAAVAGAAGSMAGTAAVSVINNRGNLGDTFDDTLSSDSLKGAALAAATAAASGWLDDAMNTSSNSVIDKTSLDGVLKFVGRRAAQAGTDAALETAIQGGSFSDAVTHNLEGALATAFQAELFNFIGDKTTDAVDNSNGRFMLDGSVEKMLVHALAGGLAAEATGSDFRSGSIAAGANEALVTQLAALVGNDPTLLVSASKITGILAAGMAGGDVEKGAEVAGNATAYNYLTHLQIEKYIDEAKNCGARGDCAEVQARYQKLSLVQQDELIENCASDPGSCAGLYQSLVDEHDQFREALDKLGGRGLATQISLDAGPLLGQYMEAESVISQDGFAQSLKNQYGLDNEQASIVSAAAAIAISGGVSRRGAFKSAKRDAGIPQAQAPESVGRVPMTDRSGKTLMNSDGKRIMTREYKYKKDDGSKIIIQDHSAGHKFGRGGLGDQGAHFNVRPEGATRTGRVMGTKDHYSWGDN